MRCASKSSLAVATVALALAAVLPSHGTTIHVPGDQPTIQAGIDSAAVGDTVLVAPGTYTGPLNRNLDFGGTNIVLRGIGGPDSTTIDCEDQGRGFWFHSGEDLSSVVEGFVIANGHGDYGGGMRCENSSPTVKDVVFSANSATSSGGGYYCAAWFGEEPTHCFPSLNGVTFTGNTAGSDGGGVSCTAGEWGSSSILTLSDATFSGNVAPHGGGVSCVPGYGGVAQIALTDVTFLGNEGEYGGAIYCSPVDFDSDARVSITRGVFAGNSAGAGGAIYCLTSWTGEARATVTDATFVKNYAGSGGALYCFAAPVTLNGATFEGNSADGSGGAIWCEGGMLSGPGRLELTDVTLLGNHAADQGGAMYCGSYYNDAWLTGVVCSRNQADREGGGMYCGNTMLRLADVMFSDNSASAGGGMYCDYVDVGEFSNVTFCRNSAVSGGGMSCCGPVGTLTNVTWSGNEAASGGAVHWTALDPTYSAITRSILAFSSQGEAIVCDGSSYPTITHCCIYGNAGGDSLCGNYHDNLFVNPLFCDADSGDFTLRDDSPCLPENNVWGEPIGAYGLGICPTAIPEIPEEMPTRFALYPANPNPSGQATSIVFDLLERDSVTLAVFDVAGRRVRRLANDKLFSAGRHTLHWDGCDDSGEAVASGVYFYRVEAGREKLTGQVVLLR